MTNIPTLPLRAGGSDLTIPVFGFGTWEVPEDVAVEAVEEALKVGYRLVDTAAIYGNEKGVGEGIRRSGVAREDVFLTTKVWNDRQGYESTLAALTESLEKLGTDYVDLYLIHWPVPAKDAYVDTWKALLQAREDGLAKAVGVCNFQESHLRRLVDETGEAPAVNQIELHPYLTQTDLVRVHDELDIVTEDWSPLAARLDLLGDPVVGSIAQATDKDPAQVVLRWHVQKGHVVIPRSTKAARIASNLDIFSFELTDDQMTTLDGLDQGRRSGPDPDEFNLGA